MDVTIVSPIKAYISNYTEDQLSSLRKELTYTNTSIQHLIKRHADNWRWKTQNINSWEAHLEGLKKDLKKCLVFEDEGGYYIRPGSIPYLSSFNLQIENQVKYPAPKKMAWKHPPKFTLYPYQEESWTKLLSEKHGNVSLCTGAGKTKTIVRLCRETGFNAAVIAPSKAIFYELIEEFEHYLGKSNVGTFGDSKKKIGKKITVCIGDSLSNIREGTVEWEFFSKIEAIYIDESHSWGAESMEAVCHGILSNASYRWFFSGTQIRGDGSQALLDSIIGKCVYELTTEQAVLGGYISPHKFNIVEMESSNPNFQSGDALAMKREHLLRNKNIRSFIAKLSNAVVESKGEQVLVLVEELQQISDLVKLLTVPYSIAHSETKPARLLELGLSKADVSESIELFNKGISKVLIGTSCIRTGCNIYPVNHCINWIGGASEVATRQGCVGRSVRFPHQNPWAKNCGPKPFATIWDFNVVNNRVMERHLESRIEYYRSSGDNLIKYIRLSKSN
jgi:superfamily II DNA or RNA helicase